MITFTKERLIELCQLTEDILPNDYDELIKLLDEVHRYAYHINFIRCLIDESIISSNILIKNIMRYVEKLIFITSNIYFKRNNILDAIIKDENNNFLHFSETEDELI